MNTYRQAITALTFLVVSCSFMSPSGTWSGSLTTPGAAQDVINNRKPTFEERLKFGLRVRTADEQKFIKLIVGMVKAGKLKRSTVDQAFFWVQREIKRKEEGDPNAKKHIDKYPFFYFKQIVILNAKRSGVVIPK